jgi:hypothetical protein
MNEAGNKATRQARDTRADKRVNVLKRLSAVFVLAALVSYFPSRSLSAAAAKSSAPLPIVTTVTRAGRLPVFDDAWSTINERYYDSLML